MVKDTTEDRFDTHARMLVVEDHDGLVSAMQEFLRSVLAKTQAIVIGASSTKDASAQLKSAPYRATSFDMGLPISRSAPEISVQSGYKFFFENVKPLAQTLIYTGNAFTSMGLKTAALSGQRHFIMLSKGAINKVGDDDSPSCATPGGWADVMAYLSGVALEELHERAFIQELIDDTNKQGMPDALKPWFDAYWLRAQDYLPRPLAQAAFDFVRACARFGSIGTEAVVALNDFREWALTLAQAQTAVVLRAGGARSAFPAISRDRASALLGLEARLAQSAGQINPLSPGGRPWLNYLGSNGRRTQFQACVVMAALRIARNAAVHTTQARREQVDGTLKDKLAPLMDMASFWADCPLLMNLRAEGGHWVADAIWGRARGERWPLPGGVRVPPPNSTHAYQVLWQFASEDADPVAMPAPVLVDWWPWLQVGLNTGSGLREPLLLSHPLAPTHAGSHRWQAFFLSGEATVVTVPDTAFH